MTVTDTHPVVDTANYEAAPSRAKKSSRSYAVLAGVMRHMPGLSLEGVSKHAKLQTRVDTKYLVTPEQFLAALDRVRDELNVLDIDGQRIFGYDSVYFDTPALRTFRDHKQGKRHRFKVRTRLYENSGDCMLEVKVKDPRGQTVKHRKPYDAKQRGELTPEATRFIDQMLYDEYGFEAPELEAALNGTYSRGTFVDIEDASRITCDVGLAWERGSDRVSGPDALLVETKSADGFGRFDQALRAERIRPVKISKYAVGTALLHPHLAANKWNRILRHDFGWEREEVPMPGDAKIR